MTLERLKQYRDQCQELQQLKADITRAQLKMHRITTDSVRGSMPEHPYVEHTVVVRGIDVKYADTMHHRIALMEHRQKKLAAQCLEIGTWIAGLADSKLRQIIALRFVKGYEWWKVARVVYGSPRYEDAVKKRVYRFFSKCPKCPESP